MPRVSAAKPGHARSGHSGLHHFHLHKSCPWQCDPHRRKNLLGCLKARLKSAFERKYHDLGCFGANLDLDHPPSAAR